MLTDHALIDAPQTDPPRSNILGNVPERLAVGCAGAERDRDSAAASLAELLDVIAEHEGARPVDPAQRLREILAAKPVDCEHLFVAAQEAGKRSGDVWRIADSIGIEQRDDEDTYQWLERSVRELQAKARRTDRRPRIFTFANGSEIDVDRYLGLDATAISRTDHGDRPAITFQLGHGGFLRVAFESEQQRADELARLRAFRDGAA